MTNETYAKILKLLKDYTAGTEFEGHVYAVGGCVRDSILGREIKDIDLVVDIPNGGINLARFFESEGKTSGSVVVYEHFGTAMFRLKDEPDIELEAVQTRSECYHDMESRNPDTAFGTIEEDCHRRDFTFNALYYNVHDEKVRDFNGYGLDDLKMSYLRTCGDPDIIFTEDPLRIMRAVRFATKYHTVIDKGLETSLIKNVDRLKIISRERIMDELNKILECDNRAYGVLKLSQFGILTHLFGEKVSKMGDNVLPFAIADKADGHIAVWLSALLHQLGTEGAVKALKDLKYPNDTINEVEFCLNNVHKLNVKQAALPYNVRQLQHTCKTPIRFNNLILLGKMLEIDDVKCVEAVSQGLVYDNNDLFNYKLPIDGFQVQNILNIGPGVEVKKAMDELIEMAFLIGPKELSEGFCKAYLIKRRLKDLEK